MVTGQPICLGRALVYCVAATICLFSCVSSAAEPERLELEITTHLGDKQIFIEGDVVSFLLSLEADAFIHLFYYDASKNLIQIFPNSKNRNHFYRKGFFMPLPPEQTGYQLKIQAPFGVERVYAFATDNAEVQLRGQVLNNGFKLMDESVDDLPGVIRRQSESAFGSTFIELESRAR